jgi:hypothetical protein
MSRPHLADLELPIAADTALAGLIFFCRCYLPPNAAFVGSSLTVSSSAWRGAHCSPTAGDRAMVVGQHAGEFGDSQLTDTRVKHCSSLSASALHRPLRNRGHLATTHRRRQAVCLRKPAACVETCRACTRRASRALTEPLGRQLTDTMVEHRSRLPSLLLGRWGWRG